MTQENLADHADFVAAHPARQSLRGLKAAQLGIKPRAINCYRFLGGVLEEGILLNANSSMQTQPPLFVGKRYVTVDPQYPCAINEACIVRTASIRWSDKIATLRRQIDSDDSVLVHVDTGFTRVKGTKFKESFSSEIVTDGGLIAWDRNEMLVSIKPGESIDVLYADGNVRSLAIIDGRLEVKNLSIEDVADTRILYIRQKQARLRENLTGDDLIRAVDRLYHELVAVLAIGGKRSQAVFESVYKLLGDDGDRGLLGGGVQRHVLEVLGQRPEYALRFKITCASRRSINESQNVVPSAAPASKPKGPPADRRAKLAARAERDRQARQNARGSSSDQSLKGSSKKSKKK